MLLRCLALLALSFHLVAFALPARANEARCTALGSVCSCNETLDATGYVNEGQSSTVVAFNPSGDGNTKQCGGFQDMQVQRHVGGTPTSEINFIPETGMPVGNTVTNVFRLGHADAAVIVQADNPFQNTTKRACFRYYLRMSPNHDGGDILVNPSSPGCAGPKVMQMGWPYLNDFKQFQMAVSGCRKRHCDWQLGTPGFWGEQTVGLWDDNGNPDAGGNLLPWDIDFNFSECYGQWCRMETCLSGDFSTGTGNFFLEGYTRLVTGPNAGKQKNFARHLLGSSGTGSSMLSLQFRYIIDGYAGYSEECGPNAGCDNGCPSDRANEWREYSHAMQGEWTIDTPGQFIGASTEVEGGGGPDTDPPTVIFVSPTNGASNVALAANVVVTFSEPMDATSVTSSNVKLLDGATPVAGDFNYNPTTREATINPFADLATAHAYSVKVESDVEDASDNAMLEDFDSTFTTVASAAGQIAFVGTTFSVVEGSSGTTNLEVLVSRQAGSSGGVSATVSLANGTATGGAALTAGIDFVNTAQVVSWNSAESGTKSIFIPINPDAVDESPSQAFTASLGSPTGGAIIVEPDEATATIQDDDQTTPNVTLAVAPATINESSGVATYTATLSAPLPTQSVQVGVSFTGTATWQASPYDFFASAPSFEFLPGQTTDTIYVTANPDAISDNNETVIITIVGVSTGATWDGDESATATITEGTVPTVALSVDTATFSETGGSVTLTATLSGTSAEDTTVVLGFDGDALAGFDYLLAGLSIDIPNGLTTGSLQFDAIHDTLDEPDELIVFRIDATSGNVVEDGDQEETSTILDNDATPSVSFTVDEATIAEAAGVSIADFALSAISGQDVTVNLGYTGTAINNGHYIRSLESVTIPHGSPGATSKITAIPNLVDEADKTVIIAIASVVNGTESGVQDETVTITDDDTITILDQCEGGVWRKLRCFFGKTWKTWWL